MSNKSWNLESVSTRCFIASSNSKVKTAAIGVSVLDVLSADEALAPPDVATAVALVLTSVFAFFVLGVLGAEVLILRLP